MNSQQTQQTLSFFEAQVQTEKLSSKAKQPFQTPATWALRADLPLVREAMRDAGGKAIKIRTPAELAALCADLSQLAQESFVVFDLNTKNTVVDRRLISLGILDASLIHPRECFSGAILNHAAAILCAHNHPSGDPTPSAEDIRITKQLCDAGEILGIKVLDHIIIGRPDVAPIHPQGFVSLRESGLVNFSK